MVELDDAVDRRLEDQPQMLLGLAKRLVRLADALEGEVGLGEGALLVARARAGRRRWACVLRIWFARIRAATPIPSTAMMAADWTAESPRASSSVATVTSAAHAETTDTLVRIGRTRCRVRSSGADPAGEGTRP